MIVVLDYGMGNSGSILNMLRKVGGDAIISCELNDIENASGIILPGVGAFDNGMQKLNSLGITSVLERRVLDDSIPFLGVCLGMQLLLSSSEEGSLPGLNWIPGSAKLFNFDELVAKSRLKIPHMGWNIVEPNDTNDLFKGVSKEERFYFVHSYAVECEDPKYSLATTNYGYPFTCSIRKGNIFGVQFHPEKSHKFGMNLFKNFLEIVKC